MENHVHMIEFWFVNLFGLSSCFYADFHPNKPTLQGFEAVDALLSATPDTPSYMIGISENKITRVPLVEAVEMVK